MVAGLVDERALLFRVPPPEEKDEAFSAVAERPDHFICHFSPAKGAVRARPARANCEGRVQEQDTLVRPP